ncbi:DUF2239 family protein [Sphingomonas sp.]|uniref:DUF2239 family protein n=1 Tax=Sphingomonas sp. TaxID=28214 RepID=UPI0035C81B4A
MPLAYAKGLISGSLADVAIAVARSAKVTEAALIFDDATGAVIDLDLRGSNAEILQLPLSEIPYPTGTEGTRS